MESAFVTYKITVNGQRKPDGCGFPGSEDTVRKMASKLYGVDVEDVRVEQED